jgi:predicted Zn-dependent protease
MKPKLINTSMSIALILLLLNGCADLVTSSGGANSGAESTVRTVPIDSRQADRLKRTMVPLLQATDKRNSGNQVRIGLIDDPSINAANAGGGEFYVTTGLLQKASDEQLRGVLAHEIAHDDLGHVAKAQVLGAGLNIGVVLLEQLFPGSSALTPIAGTLIARGYSRQEEFAADRHGMELLERAGFPSQTMERTLQWILSQEGRGGGGGGFLSSHPATEDRIAALRK